MKRILIASALFPPDVGGVAKYTKELAERLKDEWELTLLVYGHLPEGVEGISVHTVDKRRVLPLRLISFFFTLLWLLPKHDLLYIENGPSVELPATLASFILRTPLVIHVGDPSAESYSKDHWLRKHIQRLAYARAVHILRDTPNLRPEVLPLETYPEEAMRTYEASWHTHLETVLKIL